MSVELSYLEQGLVSPQGMRVDLEEHVNAVARSWLTAGVDPAVVEMTSEMLARTASHLGNGRASWESLREGLTHLALPEPVVSFLTQALRSPAGSDSLAALAVHLLDISERVALELFVPELPSVSARSDRTADAARRVGSARHLKG